MSDPRVPSPEDPSDELALIDAESLSPHWLRESPYWLIATLAHVVLLLILGTIIVFETQEKDDRPPITVRKAAPPPEMPKPKPKTSIDPVDLEVVDERPSLSEEIERIPPTAPVVKNQPIDPIEGLSGDLSGALLGEWKPRPFGDGRTPVGADDAILSALRWLARHQQPDGSWSSQPREHRCSGEAELPCADPSHTREPVGMRGFDVGVTGLALLAFSGAGYTHSTGQYHELRQSVRKGLDWLLAQQIHSDDAQLDGLFGSPENAPHEWIYNHAIATLAVSDILLSSRDRIRLKRSVEAGTQWILRSQNPGFGWKYGYQTGRNDTSVTGWMVFALKGAKACRNLRLIRVDQDELKSAFDGALTWFDSATSPRTGITGYEARGDAGSHLIGVHGEPYPYSKDLSCMTAVSLLCRIFAGESRRSDMSKAAIAHLGDHPPEWRLPRKKRPSTINFYTWYYATYALFQVGGQPWKEWMETLVPVMVENQNTKLDCDHGSWDPVGEWGVAGGRVYSTAMGALILEVFYRYRRELASSN